MLLNVAVVAWGSRCLSIMKNFQAMDPSHLRLVAMATAQKSNSCQKYAKEMGIEVFEDYQSLFSIEYLDLILEFTGDEVILCDILNRKRPTVGVLNRQASMLLFAHGLALCSAGSARGRAHPGNIVCLQLPGRLP
jgi:hypothetical protein